MLKTELKIKYVDFYIYIKKDKDKYETRYELSADLIYTEDEQKYDTEEYMFYSGYNIAQIIQSVREFLNNNGFILDEYQMKNMIQNYFEDNLYLELRRRKTFEKYEVRIEMPKI